MALTFGGSGSSGSGRAPRISWNDMTETQKLAHSIKHGTNYATKETDEAALAEARRYLERDGSPATNNGTRDNLAQLYAEQNTRGQQQEQAATNQYGMSDAQISALQGYYDRGIIDPTTNQFTAEYLENAENNGNLYEMFTGGFGLGDNDLHRSLMSQAQAGWTTQNQAANPYDAEGNDGLTFGGGSNAGDYTPSTPTFTPPPPPPQEPPPQEPPQEWEDPYQGVGPNGPLDDPENPPAGYEGGYDWNWEDFQMGAPSLDGGGGYDPNDYAFDRYVPGQESPWGIPEAEGGNKDFYRNQFVNLLRDEQNFQKKQDNSRQQRWLTDKVQSGAAKPDAISDARWAAEQERLAPAKMDWSWIDGGLPEVAVSGDDNYQYNDGYAGMNNLDALTRLREDGDISKTTYDWFRNNWQEGEVDPSAQNWWTGNNDYNELSGLGNAATNKYYQEVANGLYDNVGGAIDGVASGYAAPVAGYDPKRMQDGSATLFYNPMTSQWVTGAGLPSGTTGGAGGNQSKK